MTDISSSPAGPSDPLFWRAGAIAATVVMSIVLVFLTIDSLSAIRAGGRNVPAYTVINQAIDYQMDFERHASVPVIGGEQLLFGQKFSAAPPGLGPAIEWVGSASQTLWRELSPYCLPAFRWS